MKVTLISMVFPHPRPGVWPGIERSVGELARALVREGVEVTVLTTLWNGGPAQESWQGMRIVRLHDASRRWGKAAYAFSWNIHSFAAQVSRREELHGADAVHSFVSLPRVPQAVAREAPFFVSFPHREKARNLSDRIILAGRTGMERRCLSAAQGVFAGSRAARDDLIAAYQLDPSRVHVIPLAVDADRFTPPEDRPAGTTRVDRPGGLRMLYVGPLIPRKGLRALVESLPVLKEAGVPFRLRLLGEGPEESALRAAADGLGLNGAVEFEGFVEEPKLIEEYRQADLFVFPSLQEGFGLVLVEAMACGLPVAATGVAPMTEVVGEAGLFFPPGDVQALGATLLRLAADPDLRRRLSRKGRERVESEYVWSRVARDCMEHYRRGWPVEAGSR